ncbi:Protein of unknown function [Lysinibacillus sp. TC-37]|nr:Protein of unknown function [Lysinibacillus sp. SG9]SDB07070.1 Protein of unknown function [Lysinibacillus sp. TC-37]SFS39004.1 Protein of unknown function [Lysinibacillus sp. SG55]
MRSMEDILKEIQKLVLGVLNAQKLATVIYGNVISVGPLEVQIDQKLTLKEKQLKLTRAVMDYEVEVSVNGGAKQKAKVFNGLITGDKVTMIRVHGGQQYLIIDKEVI